MELNFKKYLKGKHIGSRCIFRSMSAVSPIS